MNGILSTGQFLDEAVPLGQIPKCSSSPKWGLAFLSQVEQRFALRKGKEGSSL